jgi:hypothetical protein
VVLLTFVDLRIVTRQYQKQKICCGQVVKIAQNMAMLCIFFNLTSGKETKIMEYKFNVGDTVVGNERANETFCSGGRSEEGLVLTVKEIILDPELMNFFCEEDDVERAHQCFDKV